MTTFSTDQQSKDFAKTNQSIALGLRDRLDGLLSGHTVTIERSASVHHDVMTGPVNVNMMGIMVVGDLTHSHHYYGAFAIASQIPVLVVQQLPSRDRMMVNGVLTNECSNEDLLQAIEKTFALSQFK